MAGLISFACGVQGPTQPPRIEKPERVTDFAVTQIGKTLQFSFTLPGLATDGERLTKPQEVEILREVVPAGGAASGAAGSLAPWQSLTSGDVEKHTKDQGFAFSVPLSTGETRPVTIRFAIRTLTRGFRQRRIEGELSNLTQISLLDVPEAVQGLRAVTTEKAIELAWQATAPSATAYRLFRNTTGGSDSFAMLCETTATEYRDAEFEFGRTYVYKVIAIVKEGATVAATEDSRTIEVTPHDTFPPAAPQGLTAVYTADAVELIWNASTAADLRGYHVYRQEDGAEETRMTTDPLSTPIFRDPNVSPGRRFAYRVTALDLAGNESSRSDKAAAEGP